MALACALSACGPTPVGPYPEASVFLVVIDTLRADRLPAYGYAKGSTPHLDQLVREAVLFEDVYAHCPLTLPAHASLFTGLIPPHHGVRTNSGFNLPASHSTLASRLRSAGWRTGGAVSSFVMARQSGIHQGFDFYEDSVSGTAPEAFNAPQRDGAVTLEALSGWIDAQGEARVFAFLHLYEPHSPYAPPERHASRGDAYDGEVAYADELVGRFVAKLRESGRYDMSLIVVTSDHGEMLGEHGEDEHGIFLYRPSLHVPLIVKLPEGRRAGERVAGLASQVDITATILDLVGLPLEGLDGGSLRPSLEGQERLAQRVYSESLYPRYTLGWSELRGVTTDQYHYVRAPRPELYDRATDRVERKNLAQKQWDTVQQLDTWLVQTTADEPVPLPANVPAETAEQLRALGYLSTTGAAVGATGLPDPKDRIAFYPKLKAALDAFRDREYAAAVPQLRELIEENPRMMQLREMLAESLVATGQPDQGLEVLNEALKLERDRPAVHLALVRLHLRRGDIGAALRHAEPAAGNQPGGGAELLASLLVRQGDLERALAFIRRSLAEDPKRFVANYMLGVLEQKAGRCEASLKALRRAREARSPDPASPGLHAKMGSCLAELGQDEEAERQFLEEIKLHPEGAEARFGLARLYWRQERHQEARAVLEQWLTVVPHATADVYWMLIRMFLTLKDVESASDWSKIAHELFPADKRFRGGVS